MKDNLRDKNLDVPSRSCPKSPPSSPEEDPELLPFGSIFCTLDTPLQPDADMKTDSPYKKDQCWEKHEIENEVLVHDSITRKGQSA
jgi:hypothetical protein